MSLAFFSSKNLYYKNGIWWFTKIANKALGEERYDKIRIARRLFTMRNYYYRQQMLYELFVDYNEIAALCGVYPKIDLSHGFPNPLSYEMYRDFQENNINSDGWFGMWLLVIAIVYIIHMFYNYMMPYYWIKYGMRNAENLRLRMRDAIGSTVMEELYGTQYMEMAFTPHDFAYQRHRGIQGYSNPDDPRVMHMATFNRKHRYKEHYLEAVGKMEGNSMKSDR